MVEISITRGPFQIMETHGRAKDFVLEWDRRGAKQPRSLTTARREAPSLDPREGVQGKDVPGPPLAKKFFFQNTSMLF